MTTTASTAIFFSVEDICPSLPERGVAVTNPATVFGHAGLLVFVDVASTNPQASLPGPAYGDVTTSGDSADVDVFRRPGDSNGDMSRRVLPEIQARVTTNDAATVVLVEGLSDCFAIEAAALRCGRDLRAAGADVLPLGGATNISHFLERFGPAGRNVRLAGLCDLGEEALFARRLERAGLADRVDRATMESLGFFVCVRDLEDELIRALGPRHVEAVIEREGDLASLRTLQQMPFHRLATTTEHLHRFMGVRSGRKYRYAPLLASALEAKAMPRPLVGLLDHVCGTDGHGAVNLPS